MQFLLIGVCIYGAYALFGVSDEDYEDMSVRVDSDRIDAFIGGWESRWNRPPTREEIDGVIEQYVREEVLYRQAVAMGLGENDPITRRRMAQKLEFLTSDLAQMKQPAEGELEQYFQENRATYREPDLITFIQVFFDPDSRDEATLDDAEEALAELQGEGEPDPETLQAGDRVMVQNYFQSVTEVEVGRQLGSGFTQSVMDLEAGKWHGPVLSGYGVHLVYVYDVQEGAPPVLTEVKAKVLEAWHEEQSEQFNAELLENLKSRYDIVIDELPEDRLINTSGSMAKEESVTGELFAQ